MFGARFLARRLLHDVRSHSKDFEGSPVKGDPFRLLIAATGDWTCLSKMPQFAFKTGSEVAGFGGLTGGVRRWTGL